MQKQKKISTLVGVIIIVAVAVVLFGGVFTYQYFAKKNTVPVQTDQPVAQNQTQTETQTATDETANWKTYINEDMGYEIKYPNDIENVKHDEKLSLIDGLHFYKLENNNTIYSFDIDVSTLGNAKTVEEIIGSQFLNPEISNFAVDGISGKKVSSENGFDGIIIKDNLEYRFHCKEADYANYNCSTFNKMLSTFKFTK